MITDAPTQPQGMAAMRTPRGAVVWWRHSWEGLQGYWLEVKVGSGQYSAVNSAPRLHRSFAYRCEPRTPQETLLTFRVRSVDVCGNLSPWQEAVAD